MKKILLLLALCAAAFGQSTTTVTGNLKNLGTGSVSSGSFVRFYLRGCAGNLPRINGTAIIAPTLGNVFYFDFVPNSSGTISGTLYSTRDATGLLGGAIECGGSTTAVWYGYVPFLNGKAGPETPVHALASATLDISNITPITTNPVVAAPAGDSTYIRKDSGNMPITGALSACTEADGTPIAGSSCYATINAALAACPAAPAACHIGTIAGTNYTMTTGYSNTNAGQPIYIEGHGSDQNFGGTKIAFAPATAPATAFFIQNGSRLVFRNATLVQQSNNITSVTGTGNSAVYTTTSNHGFVAGTTYVSIQNLNPQSAAILANNVTALVQTTPAANTFTINNSSAIACASQCGFVNLSGPICTLTNIVGNGTTATGTCSSGGSFTPGQPIIITGNTNGSFNVSAVVATASGTTFTFPSPTNATGTGGNAQQGVNGIVLQGAQGAEIDHSMIYEFSGVGVRVGDVAANSGIYDQITNSRVYSNQINLDINQIYPTQAVSQTVVVNSQLTFGNLMNVRCTGICSELSMFSGDISGNSNPLVQCGDNVTLTRDCNFYNVTMESSSFGITNQVGIQNNAAQSFIHTEGGLTGAGSLAVKDGTVTGAGHHMVKGSSFANPAGCPSSGWSENTAGPIKWDCNGNLGMGAAPTSGTALSINSGGTGGLSLGSSSTYPMVVTSSGIRGNGAAALMGTLTHGWLSYDFTETTAPSAGSGDDVCYGDSTAHAVKCSFNNGSFSQVQRFSDTTMTLKKGSGGGNYTTASTTYVVVDSSNLCLAIGTVPTGQKVTIHAQGSVGTSTAIVAASVALTDNASCSTANAGILQETQVSAGAIGATAGFALGWVITGDGSTNHNIALQFKTANASDSALMSNSSATLLPTMVFTQSPSN